jgi:cytochrome b561
VWEQHLARWVHATLYLLLFALMLSGYLITTADGRPVYVFDWFAVPATLTGPHQEDIAGEIHQALAWSVIALALLHTAAAFKHHFLDRDRTLTRMLGLNSTTSNKES